MRDSYLAYAGARPADLWLMLGDNAYVAGTDAEYQAAVFGTYPAQLATTPLWPAFGNHDGGSANGNTGTGIYFDIFRLPKAAEAGGVASGSEAYYPFDAGNVHFVCLDAYDVSRLPGSPMLTWLAADLAATTQTWIVAYWHHPPYTKGTHDSDTETELIEMRQYVNPILEAGGVDLVLAGHSHVYTLLPPRRAYGNSTTFAPAMKKDGGTGHPAGTGPYRKPSARTPHAGAVYVVAGSGGQLGTGPLNDPAMLRSFAERGSTGEIDVNAGRLDVRFVRVDGVVRDSFAIVKSGAGFHTLPPCRAVDTRVSGGALAAGRSGAVAAGACGIPATATAVSATAIPTGASAAGALAIFPGDLASPPGVETVRRSGAGQTLARTTRSTRPRVGRLRVVRRAEHVGRPGARDCGRERLVRVERAPAPPCHPCMKAIRVHAPGGPKPLLYEDVADPSPKAGEALVKVEAAGVNFIEVYFRTGVSNKPAVYPFTPGSEAAGVVEAVGPGVTEVAPGDRVATVNAQGAYAERALVAAARLVRVPEGVTTRQAAAANATLQGMTAHYLATSTRPLGPGDTCLVHAAAGGVGLLPRAIAKKRGARVIGTVQTPEKAALARAAGADEVILYTEQDFVAETKRLTGGKALAARLRLRGKNDV